MNKYVYNNFLSTSPETNYICKLNKPTIEKPQLSNQKQQTARKTKDKVKSKKGKEVVYTK